MDLMPDPDVMAHVQAHLDRGNGSGLFRKAYRNGVLLGALAASVKRAVAAHVDCPGCDTCRELQYGLAVVAVTEIETGQQIG
jgi:hypothetical protein